MEPIVLIHGYSSETGQSSQSELPTLDLVRGPYGSLPKDLPGLFPGTPILPVNVSRYISLDDSVSIDDISLAFDRVLKKQYPELLENGFNVIVHSTGALVIRNWIRRCSPRPSPVKRVIHLAGANLGSGWAHIGESLLAKWLRFIGQEGAERGLAVLDALELGSSWTLDLHEHFLHSGNLMLEDYGTMEFNIIGSQVPAKWFIVPFRYGKEDGSDGVVRISASNLNFHYLAIKPTDGPQYIDWEKALEFSQEATQESAEGQTASSLATGGFGGDYYQWTADYRPHTDEAVSEGLTSLRPTIPLAIPYQCAHSSDDIGIVYGTQTRQEVLRLISSALTCEKKDYSGRVAEFEAVTASTYRRVAQPEHTAGIAEALQKFVLGPGLTDPRAQYDRHSQVVFRLRDQHGQPIKDYSIYFNSSGGGGAPQKRIDSLFEDHHRNNTTPNVITFYLRTDTFIDGSWSSRLAEVNGVDLEIDAIDAETDRILFVPLRVRLSSQQLMAWIKPHRTTIIDVELLRLPSDDTFVMLKDENPGA